MCVGGNPFLGKSIIVFGSLSWLFIAVILVRTNEDSRGCTCNVPGILDACHSTAGSFSRGWTAEEVFGTGGWSPSDPFRVEVADSSLPSGHHPFNHIIEMVCFYFTTVMVFANVNKNKSVSLSFRERPRDKQRSQRPCTSEDLGQAGGMCGMLRPLDT